MMLDSNSEEASTVCRISYRNLILGPSISSRFPFFENSAEELHCIQKFIMASGPRG